MVTATKSSELVLSEPIREFYNKCWKIADEALGELGKEKRLVEWLRKEKRIESARALREDLQRIKDPYKYNDIIMTEGMFLGRSRALNQLSDCFAEKNKLPYVISSRDDITQILEYVRKNHGVETRDLKILESSDENWHGTREHNGTRMLYYAHGVHAFSSIYSIQTILHEMDHINNKNAWRLDCFLDDLYKCDIRDEHAKKLRRAIERYLEGKATFAESKVLGSKDAFVRAYSAIEFTDKIASPLPAFYKHKHDTKEYTAFSEAIAEELKALREETTIARKYKEGFRDYYTLQAIVGKERLDYLEDVCDMRGLFLGIDESNLVVVDPERMTMREINLEKLNAGITDIKELTRKSERIRIPKNLN